jgi:hypothetical protein
MEVNTFPEQHVVALTSLENVFLKAAVMSLMGALTTDPQAIVLGATAGRGFLMDMGLEGLNELAAKLDAHRVASKDDGSMESEAPPAPLIISLDDALPEPSAEGNDVG